MKKQGFTLTELLLTLAIIAVASAAIAPMANNFMPDKYKTKVLKYYNAVATTTSNLLDNGDLYYDPKVGSTDISDYDENGVLIPSCTGLACTLQPVNSAPYSDSANATTYSGDNKYPNLLKSFLGIDLTTSKLPDGSTWTVAKCTATDATCKGGYRITIDMDSNNSKNCSYSSSCKKPDTFLFKVSNSGDVFPDDNLTYVYLQNPDRMNKKEDFAAAANVAANDLKNTDLFK